MPPAVKSEVLLLGIDLGSSGVKVTLFSTEKGILNSATSNVDLISKYPGWSEADTNDWLKATSLAIKELFDISRVHGNQISAVAISGMVPALVICDEQGNSLRNAILQNDARANLEISILKAKLKDLDFLKKTGSTISQQSIIPKLMWLAKNEKELFANTKIVLGSYDWLALQIGAKPSIESNWALESGIFSVELKPLDEIRNAAGINWPTLPEVVYPGEVIGEINQKGHEITGLPIGVPIVVGGADHVLSAYGAGLVNEGDCLVKLGGAGDILVVSNKINIDSRLYLDLHPITGKWLPNGCMATSGSLLRWEQSIFNNISLTDLDDAAAKSKPGNLITLPYFLGEKTPLNDPDLRGVMIGMNLSTTQGDIHRSFLEAIAYGFKAHIQVFELCNISINSIKVTNGGSKSKLWREILADVLNQELRSIVQHPGASLGAAIAAGIGIKAIDNWEVINEFVEVGQVIKPNDKNIEIYQSRFEDFIELGKSTKEISHNLAKHQ